MSLILIAVIYNVYFSPSTFKYAILMQKVKYVPAQRVHFVWSRVVFGFLGVFDLSFAHRNTRVSNLLIFQPEFTDSARVYEHARSRRPFRGTAQTVTVRRTQTRSALGAAKHTHRHRAPPLVGLSVYLDCKGMGPTVM